MQITSFSKKGFTLIELLIVVGILSILTGVVIFAVNPAKQFGIANNAERRVEIKKIVDAINQYTIDRRGKINDLLPAGYVFGTTISIVSSNSNGPTEIDLSPLVPIYITPGVPLDPHSLNNHDTGYDFLIETNGQITISAPMAELGVGIFLITRAS